MADIGINKLITLDADGILEFSHHILNRYENAALIIIIFLEVLLIPIMIKIIKMDIMRTADQIRSGSFKNLHISLCNSTSLNI